MDDGNELIYRAGAHEVGHSFVKFLLSGHFGPIEVSWSEPGNGDHWIRWPADWPDETLKYWLFSGLVDAGGIEAEWLLCQKADSRHSRSDLTNLATAARELAETKSEFRGSDPGMVVALFRGTSGHLLKQHATALKYLADRVSRKRRWTDGELERALLADAPQYRGVTPLFEGADWRANWVSLLDAVNADLEATVGWANARTLRALERKVARIGADIRMRA